MSATLGRNASIKVGGTPTTMTAEACSSYAAGWSPYAAAYQITAATKRAIDPNTSITVYIGGVAQSATSYEVDYAHGIIGFSIAPGGTVTITAKYIPLLTVAEAHSASITFNRDAAEVSCFGDTGKRQKLTNKSLEISFELWSGVRDDIDDGAGTWTIDGIITTGAPVFAQVDLGQAYLLRGWVVLKKSAVNSKQGEANAHSVDAEGVIQTCAGRSEQALFSWK